MPGVMRWHYRDPLLAWLLPAAYGMHILEEWLLGFPEWLALAAGSPLPRRAFISVNAVAFTSMLAATRAAIRSEKNGWLSVAIAAVLLVNALAHILGTLVTGTYSPGLFTGVTLYLPLSQLTLLRAWSQAAGGAFGKGICAGLLVHLCVSLLAFALTRQ